MVTLDNFSWFLTATGIFIFIFIYLFIYFFAKNGQET